MGEVEYAVVRLPPGELLEEEFLKPMGITRYRLAKEVGVPAGRIGQIIAGKRAITADTDARLCRFFSLSRGYWLRMQAAYEAEVASEELASDLEKIIPWKVRSAHDAIPFEKIEAELKRLAERYQAEAMYVFGSYARGEAQEDSDLDVLVVGGPRFSSADIFAIAEELFETFGKRVDVYEISELEKGEPFYDSVMAE